MSPYRRLDHARIDVVQLLLDGGAAALGFDDQARVVSPPCCTSFSATLRFSTVSVAR